MFLVWNTVECSQKVPSNSDQNFPRYVVVPYESAYTATSQQIYTAYDHNPDDLGRRVAGMDVLY